MFHIHIHITDLVEFLVGMLQETFGKYMFEIEPHSSYRIIANI